ncbi:MAG TPA: DNA helicase RecQ [Gammaproteobacteria bacterium]|nr:DNA helicase RecQ [Gammaproteobacteria bacterium]
MSSERALEILRSVFGYDRFRGDQAEIIDTLSGGQDALVLMPTGGGKSLCYQIPALIRPGVGIVVSPLIALMKDQVDAAAALGIRAACLNSTLGFREQQWIEEQLTRGELDLLYIAPERLLTDRMLELLGNAELALFAIDEAHCVSQWGHDFRPEYQQLSILHERFPGVPRVALTATADARTRGEIVAQLRLQRARQFVASFDRPNIRYAINDGQNPRARLWSFLEREHPEDAGIVYCLSRSKVESTAEWLAGKGRVALPYHAGLPAAARQRHQERFLREEGVIIVATIAFGMGIDKPDVRFVAHLSLPKSIEAYYQETGRAGRDGEPANAWMAYGLQDVISLRQMVESSTAPDAQKRIMQNKLQAMLGLCELSSCRRQALLAYFGETLAEPCGNCDNCLNPPQVWNGTEAARKALSCVYRTGQRFGVNYVIDVLIGKDDERIVNNRHNQLSTYGIGADISQNQWRSVFRQLITAGYLRADMERYGALTLTPESRPLLRGEIEVHFRKQTRPSKEKSVRKKIETVLENAADERLFERLREERLSIARELGVPPYVIFHDSTLREMAVQQPLTPEGLLQISGVGESKLEKFGEAFLAVIHEFQLMSQDG